MIAMTLIGHAGETKSLAYQAMNAAKEGKFNEAEIYRHRFTPFHLIFCKLSQQYNSW